MAQMKSALRLIFAISLVRWTALGKYPLRGTLPLVQHAALGLSRATVGKF